jgi:hypothetical protein
VSTAKPETRFIAAVNRHLPLKRLRANAGVREKFPPERWIHYEKMHNDFRGGTADAWYSGIGGDLWIEYKFLPRIPRRGLIEPQKLLSALQADWLNERRKEGRNVAVIVGCPAGGVLLKGSSWTSTYTPDEWRSLIYSVPNLAEWIWSQTGRKA